MGLGTWLSDKSKRKQLENVQTALRNVFTSMLASGDMMPEDQAVRVFQASKDRYVETVATEAGGILKGAQMWPAFAVSMEAAEEALPAHLAPVAQEVILDAYRRAAQKWNWPPERQVGAHMPDHWKTFARLLVGHELTDAEAEEMVSQYSRFGGGIFESSKPNGDTAGLDREPRKPKPAMDTEWFKRDI